MGTRFTERGVAAIKPPEKKVEIADALVVGLYLYVTPGGAKSWCVRYRFEGRPRRLGLGKWPAIDVATARDLARAALQKVAKGTDPAAPVEKDETTVADLWAAYCRRHVDPHLRERTAAEYKAMMDKHVLPQWGGRDVRAIQRRDVNALAMAMEKKGLGARRNRVLSLVRTFFSWCERQEFIDANPAANVQPAVPERPRQRLLSDAELAAIWRASLAMGTTGAFVRFLMLTACRRSEAAGARWCEIDLAARRWIIPADKAKNHRQHVIHLAEPTAALLEGLPRFAGTDYVFSTNGRSPISGFGKIKARLDKLMADTEAHPLAPWVAHDFRRAFSSGLARMGMPLQVAERCLSHASGSLQGVAGIYNVHSYEDEMRAAWIAWADHLVAIAAADDGRAAA